MAPVARREPFPATLALGACGKRARARAREAPEGLALARARPHAMEARSGNWGA